MWLEQSLRAVLVLCIVFALLLRYSSWYQVPGKGTCERIIFSVGYNIILVYKLF